MTNENPTSGSGKSLSIAGLVIGIVALLFSFIPCLGMYAVFPGAVAILLSVVGLIMSSKAKAPIGMAIAALAVSIIGCAIAGYQYYTITQSLAEAGTSLEGLGEAMQHQLDSIKEANPEMMEEMNINGKLDSINDAIENSGIKDAMEH